MKKLFILTSLILSVATTGAFAALVTDPVPAPAAQTQIKSAPAKTGKHKHKKHRNRNKHHAESKKTENN